MVSFGEIIKSVSLQLNRLRFSYSLLTTTVTQNPKIMVLQYSLLHGYPILSSPNEFYVLMQNKWQIATAYNNG